VKCMVNKCDFNKDGSCLLEDHVIIQNVDENGNILTCDHNTAAFQGNYLHSLNHGGRK